MQTISFEHFLTLPKRGYVFFFSLDGYCGLCKQYESELIKYDIPKLIKVDAKTEEQLMEIGVGAVPCTRFYDTNDKVSYERYGILYQKQMQELLEAFQSQ